MDLRQYLTSRHLTQKEFADMVGISRTAISHYVAKRRIPTLLIAMKIKEMSNNKVSLEDLTQEK